MLDGLRDAVLLTNKIFQMQWMLLRSVTNLVSTLYVNVTGILIDTLILLSTIYFSSSHTHIVIKAMKCLIRSDACVSGTSGEGLYEGLAWLSNNIANKVGSLVLLVHCSKELDGFEYNVCFACIYFVCRVTLATSCLRCGKVECYYLLFVDFLQCYCPKNSSGIV